MHTHKLVRIAIHECYQWQQCCRNSNKREDKSFRVRRQSPFLAESLFSRKKIELITIAKAVTRF